MHDADVLITKADGSTEPFDESKLRASLERAKADADTIDYVVSETRTKLHAGMSTKEIYDVAFQHLKQARNATAARYAIRRALLDLGPSGFPFEEFIAQIYRELGYQAVVGLVVEGACASHEIDVTAYRDDECIAIEAKFHNKVGTKSDLKDVLYVKSRVDDVTAKPAGAAAGHRAYTDGVLITNTKFTTNARQYAQCAPLHAISWNHPKTGSLHDLIERTGVYPVTCLSTLSGEEKETLLNKHVALCQNLAAREDVLRDAGIAEERIGEIIKESAELCSGRG